MCRMGYTDSCVETVETRKTMKRLAYLKMAAAVAAAVMAAALVAASCSQEGSEEENTGTPEGCPVTYVRLPASPVYSGDRIAVIGTGFSKDAGYFLVDSGGESVRLEDVTVTASGIEIPVPVGEGEYMFVIEQDGRWELGTLHVEVRKLDISISSCPEYCLPGGSFTVSGTGFGSAAGLILEDPDDGSRTALSVRYANGSLSATLPDDCPRGKLSLILSQDGSEEVISDRFFVTSRKWLTGISFTVGSGESASVRSLTVTRDGSGAITGCSGYTISEEASGDAGGSAGGDADGTADGAVIYTFTHIPAASDEDYEFPDYIFKTDTDAGRVLSHTVMIEREDEGGQTYYEPREIEWSYDDMGYLVYFGQGTADLECVDGNLNQSGVFAYEDPQLCNNPFAVDFVLSTMASSDPQIFLAQLYGWCGECSVNLPSGRSAGGATAEITYEFDDEGYLTLASFREGILPVSIKYEYR